MSVVLKLRSCALEKNPEKAVATHSSTPSWKIPWTEESGGLQSMGSRRVGHDWATSLSLFTFITLEKELATHSNILAWRIPGTEEPGGLPPMGLQSRTRLMWLSSSSREESFISWGLLWWSDSGMCVGACIGVCVLGAGGLIALYT